MSAPETLSILALEPWLGGSHARTLELWGARSAHAIQVAGLPARHWKWRMQGAAPVLAQRVAQGPPPDALFASGYLDLPTFRGFLPPAWRHVPALAYFHETQFTYPRRTGEEEVDAPDPDYSYGFKNVLTCLAAERVVFNSAFHRDAFGAAAERVLAALPGPNLGGRLIQALDAARVVAPGVDVAGTPLGPGAPAGAPLRVLWNHRWEHDKDPLAFLDAVRCAVDAGARLELELCGASFERSPDGVAQRLEGLGQVVRQRGFRSERRDYVGDLGQCDVVVSCARHEFFGVSVLEALAAGCRPLVPRRLAYPELLAGRADAFYADDADLAARLVELAHAPDACREPGARAAWRALAQPFDAAHMSDELDDLLRGMLPRPA